MFIRATAIGLVMVLVAQESKAVDWSTYSHSYRNAQQRVLATQLAHRPLTPEEIKEREKLKPVLTSWNAGKEVYRKLDSRRKFSVKKLEAKNALKIAQSEARRNKAEFQNVFAMGFVSECYQLKVGEIEEAAKKMSVRKELTEIVSVANYLQ